MRPTFADVVELVDTLASGASAFTGVGVRVSPSAPTHFLVVGAKYKASKGRAFKHGQIG